MRLIDADELRRWLNGYLETDNISPTYIRALIDSQQTVEAIPVEWLDTYTTDCSIDLRDNDANAIKKLVKDWREENGKENN